MFRPTISAIIGRYCKNLKGTTDRNKEEASQNVRTVMLLYWCDNYRRYSASWLPYITGLFLKLGYTELNLHRKMYIAEIKQSGGLDTLIGRRCSYRRARISQSVQWQAVPCHGSVGSDRIDSRPVHVGFVVDKFALVEATLLVLRSTQSINSTNARYLFLCHPLLIILKMLAVWLNNTLKKHTVTRLRAGWMRERGLISDRCKECNFYCQALWI